MCIAPYDEAELEDKTGVQLITGRPADKTRSMVAIKAEKIERARTYRRVNEAGPCTSPPLQVYLGTYLCDELGGVCTLALVCGMSWVGFR